MEVKWIQLPFSVVKKWLLFLIVPVVAVSIILIWASPTGEDEAKNKLAKASREVKRATDSYLKTRKPEDMEHIKQAELYWNKASSYITESEYELASEAADESLSFSKKIKRAKNIEASDIPGSIKFDELIGKVLVKPAGSQEEILATKNMILSPGDRIRTGQYASCRLYFQDGLVTVIRPNALVTIKSTVKGRQDPNGFVNLQLDTGKLTFKSAFKQVNKARVGTKAGEAQAFDQSDIFISYSALEVATDLSVYKGKALAQAGDFSTEVRVNQMLTMRDDQSLSNLFDLPAAPKLIRPDNHKKYAVEPGEKAPVLMGWESEEGIASYHLELSPNILFTEHNYENNRYFRNQIEFTNLTEGVYFWRVSSNDSSNREGPPSDVFQFQIGQELISNMVAVDNQPPKLKVTYVSVYGYTVLISGKITGGTKVLVNGKLAVLDNQTGKFSYAMNMPSAGVHRIRVVAKDDAGNKVSVEKSVLIDD